MGMIGNFRPGLVDGQLVSEASMKFVNLHGCAAKQQGFKFYIGAPEISREARIFDPSNLWLQMGSLKTSFYRKSTNCFDHITRYPESCKHNTEYNSERHILGK